MVLDLLKGRGAGHGTFDVVKHDLHVLKLLGITVFCIACLLQKCLYFDIYQVLSLQTSQINQFWIFFFSFSLRGGVYMH